MYENASKLMAKQKVALEVLSYHASSSLEETKKLMVRGNWMFFYVDSFICVKCSVFKI